MAVFAEAPGELLAIASPDDLWAAVAGAEPAPRRSFPGEAVFEEALAGFGDAADLKSPWFIGHSRGGRRASAGGRRSVLTFRCAGRLPGRAAS